MRRSQKKKSRPAEGNRVRGLQQLATGMPALDSVQKVVDFVSPQGSKYKILKTTETDAYDQPPKVDRKRRNPRGS
jgi:hypothetical protein